MTAAAMGCLEVSSAAAAKAKTRRLSYFLALTETTLTTCGRPSVSVPVLSKIKVSASFSVSRQALPLISTPLWAAVLMAADRAAAVERRMPQE